MSEFWTKVEALFNAAAELPSSARPAFLDERCAAQPDLRAEIESLLAAHDSATGFLRTVTKHAVRDPIDPAFVGTGTLIGSYRLLECIGEGGMGVVYRGERADGLFAHAVAVKVTRAALPDADATRRFRAERQILATLHHPNVVTLLDGGTLASGRAYLVMELVDGQPITSWCRERRASLHDRLRLFRQVCSAVHHAHGHEIVHRDLKPANILVTGEGAPKVLDFGVAKLLAPPAGLEGRTVTSVFPGPLTANYASPEQLRGLAVTSVSDVYALGILLYELLTGWRPYETSGRPLDDLLHVVAVADRVKPSASPSFAEAVIPYGRRRLRGELDSIVLKAIAKRPEDRYVSVEALSADIARFLEHRPVLARRSSFAHGVRKLAGTYRRVAAAPLILSAAVIAGSLIAGVPSVTPPREDSSSPRSPRGGTMNVAAAQAYQEGRKLWDTRMEFARAAAAFRRAIAADPQFALAHVGLADTLAMWQVPSPESERALAEAFRLEPSLGEAYATQGFLRMFHYWDWVGAEESFRRAIELAPDYATAHHWQGTLFSITRRFDAAEAALKRAAELAPTTAVILGDLGLAAHWRGDHARAAEICERAGRLEASSFVTGCLLSVYPRQGRYREAAQLRGNTLLSVFEQQGYDAMLRELLAATESMGYGGMYDATLLHAELGQKAAAIDALHRLILTHHFMAPFVNVAPVFQELRGDPEFQQALRAMGLGGR